MHIRTFLVAVLVVVSAVGATAGAAAAADQGESRHAPNTPQQVTNQPNEGAGAHQFIAATLNQASGPSEGQQTGGHPTVGPPKGGGDDDDDETPTPL